LMLPGESARVAVERRAAEEAGSAGQDAHGLE
jgi:hypothetical protein